MLPASSHEHDIMTQSSRINPLGPGSSDPFTLTDGPLRKSRPPAWCIAKPVLSQSFASCISSLFVYADLNMPVYPFFPKLQWFCYLKDLFCLLQWIWVEIRHASVPFSSLLTIRMNNFFATDAGMINLLSINQSDISFRPVYAHPIYHECPWIMANRLVRYNITYLIFNEVY